MSGSPRADGAFTPEVYAELAATEAGNFWFEARNRLILWALDRYFPSARRFLEVGCGTGFVLQAIAAAKPAMEIAGSDVGDEGLAYARRRVPRARIFVGDVCADHGRDPYDVVGAFDVLEHIEDDRAALECIAAALVPRGGVLITVPQHAWLWSRSDVHSGHVRRYARRDLLARVTAAGFDVLRVTSFVSLLLPSMAALRLRGRHGDFVPLRGLRTPRPLNAALTSVMAIERGTIRAGLSWPFGGSLLVVARRR